MKADRWSANCCSRSTSASEEVLQDFILHGLVEAGRTLRSFICVSQRPVMVVGGSARAVCVL